MGYKKNKEEEVVRSTDTDVSWKLAGGGFISTVGDMARFSIARMGSTLLKAGEAGIIPAELVHLARNESTSANGKALVVHSRAAKDKPLIVVVKK